MAKQFMPELTDEQRFQLLKDNCERAEENATFYRNLTQQEIDAKQGQVILNLIDIGNYEDELDKAKAEFKAKIDPLKAADVILIECIKTRKEEIVGTLYHMADQDSGMMEVYDDRGDLIYSRSLKPEEKQLKAFPMKVIGEN